MKGLCSRFPSSFDCSSQLVLDRVLVIKTAFLRFFLFKNLRSLVWVLVRGLVYICTSWTFPNHLGHYQGGEYWHSTLFLTPDICASLVGPYICSFQTQEQKWSTTTRVVIKGLPVTPLGGRRECNASSPSTTISFPSLHPFLWYLLSSVKWDRWLRWNF